MLLEVRRLRKDFRRLRAVDDVSFEVPAQSVLGLAGESGSGKTVTGEIVARLQRPTAGQVLFDGEDVHRLHGPALHDFRRRLQMVFQDPYASLNPRHTVARAVAEPLIVHRIGERRDRAAAALEDAGLRPAARYLDRYPHELSGGERQRVAIARALVVEPEFVVADEPTSMLDVSLRSGLLLLLEGLQRRHRLTMLFISHDFSVLRYLCDRLAVLYVGRLVETGPMDGVLQEPLHPYTRLLVESVPRMERHAPAAAQPAAPTAEAADAAQLPRGCRFAPRCPYHMPVCLEVDPPLEEVAPGRHVACHLYGERKGVDDEPATGLLPR